MPQLSLETSDGCTSFSPGEEVEVVASWQHDQQPESIELRLVWYTQGKGDQDVSVVESYAHDAPSMMDSWSRAITLPMAPYSFSGKLISLLWALELVIEPGSASTRLDITLAPEGKEIVLQSVKE